MVRTRLWVVLFFLIVPAWLLCIPLVMVLVCFNGFRRAGIYLIAVSTGGTLLSLCLSTAILFLGPRIGLQHFGRWSGIALLASYVLAVIAGGLIGAAAAFSLTRKLLPRRLNDRLGSKMEATSDSSIRPDL